MCVCVHACVNEPEVVAEDAVAVRVLRGIVVSLVEERLEVVECTGSLLRAEEGRQCTSVNHPSTRNLVVPYKYLHRINTHTHTHIHAQTDTHAHRPALVWPDRPAGQECPWHRAVQRHQALGSRRTFNVRL